MCFPNIFFCSHPKTDEIRGMIEPGPSIVETTVGSISGGSASDEDDMEGCGSISQSQESLQAITAAIQKLGVQLLQNLEITPDQPNLIISPLSISLALSQLALGMHGHLKLWTIFIYCIVIVGNDSP